VDLILPKRRFEEMSLSSSVTWTCIIFLALFNCVFNIKTSTTFILWIDISS
jgi:hypothetical protein